VQRATALQRDDKKARAKVSSLNAIHDENDWDYPGYEVRVEQIGHNPAHTGGTDYRGAQHTVIARLQNEWHPCGCIPLPQKYESFAMRVQNFVKNSQGCSCWIIGNEMNHSNEWPYGRQIHPVDYGQCFRLCYERIKNLPGRETDQVIVGAPAPYNAQTTYPGNESGDWVAYFQDILNACGEFDAIALHTYGIEQVPSDPSSEVTMGGEFSNLHAGFRAYQDFLLVIPRELWHLPVYITETNPGARGDPWEATDTGWVTAAYEEIDQWNQAHRSGPLVHCLALYSHDMRADEMGFEYKPGVRRDFEQAVARGYTVPELEEPEPPDPPDPPGDCQWDEARIAQIEAQLAEVQTVLTDVLERLEVGGRGLLGE
jgi:hypothetical protein